MCDILTLGSLFDGISGFPLAGRECRIETKWTCEIEPYPRLVSFSRFPNAAQYGDICKLNGAEVEPVDIISFGSPCQSFSVAGAREGLDGASGLFYQAVRVIKEMWQATNGKYPRYAIMENVPGIYSSKSNGKSDFGVVLNEICKIKQGGQDKTIVIPEPPNGKWLNAGSILGDDFSLAWRTLCASQFGVAQRRRRMFLVVDFTGGCAVEILSEQESERRDFTPCYGKRQNLAGTAAVGVGSVEDETYCFEPGALQRLDKGAWQNQTRTIRADMGDNQLAVAYPIDLRNAVRNGGSQGTGVGGADEPSFTVTAEYTHGVCAVENHPQDGRLKICEDGKYPAITHKFGSGGGNTHFVLNERAQAATVTEDHIGALTATDYKGSPCLFEPQTMKLREGQSGNGGRGPLIQDNKSATLSCNNEQTVFVPKVYGICAKNSNSMKSSNANSGIYEMDAARALDTTSGASGNGGTVIAIQGNMLNRSDANGPGGIGFREDKAYTVNTVDNGGAVCYQRNVGALCSSDYKGIRNQDIGEDKAIIERLTFGNNGHGKWNDEPATLKSSGGDYPGGENMVVENRYAVRRLTPLECLRLQGYPDWWLDDFHIAEPREADIDYWYGVWEEHRLAIGKSKKPKSRNQIAKWLKNPYGDSNAYKAIGNSLAVPVAVFVMRGIKNRL